MVLDLLQMALRLPESQSLKEKRWLLKSLTARIKNRFNVSVSEVDSQDKWQLSTLAVAHVGIARPETNGLLDRVLEFAEGEKQIEVIDSKLDFF